MIFSADKLQGFVEVITNLENMNNKVSELYRSLYGSIGCEDDDRMFKETQDAIVKATQKAAELLSDVLVRQE